MQPQPERTVLEEAAQIVDGPRQESYGHPAENHGRTAAMWGAYLGRQVTAHDVCMLNALQKLSREAHSKSRDNLVDVVGYMRNAEMLRGPTVKTARADAPQNGRRCMRTGCDRYAPLTMQLLPNTPWFCSRECCDAHYGSSAARGDAPAPAKSFTGLVDRGRCE